MKIRDEVEWIKTKSVWFTSLFVWDNTYTPYQCAVFRSNGNAYIGIRTYYNTGDYLQIKDINTLIGSNTTEDEALFHITRALKDILVQNIDDWLSINQDYCDERKNGVDELLKEVFYDRHTMSLFKGGAPDFGFYSLSPNFHRLKKLAEEGKSPSIDEEFERLLKKYRK